MEASMEVGGRILLQWKFPWKLVEADFLPWNLVEAPMEVHGSFHRRWKRKLPLLPWIAASTNIFHGSFHELLYTSVYFHLLPRVSQTSRCFHKTSINVHRLPFNQVTKFRRFFHGSQFNSMEASMEVGGRILLQWKFPWKLVEVESLPWKLVEASMEVHGSFHCRWRWKLPLLPSIAASTNIFRGSFYEISNTLTYFYLFRQVSQTSSCFHKTNPNPNLTLELSPWKLAYVQLPWK